MTSLQKTLVVLIACVAVVLGLTFFKVLNQPAPDRKAEQLDAGLVLLQTPRVLPPVTLIDTNEQAVALNSFKDAWTLVFFGYTFCPDICPTTLAELRQIKQQLPPEVAQHINIVMITVDPARDTPQQLKEYLSFFDPTLKGLTGEAAAIEKAANAMGVPYIPAPANAGENYLVDHGANLALIGPDGSQHGFIRAPLKREKLIQELSLLAKAKP